MAIYGGRGINPKLKPFEINKPKIKKARKKLNRFNKFYGKKKGYGFTSK